MQGSCNAACVLRVCQPECLQQLFNAMRFVLSSSRLCKLCYQSLQLQAQAFLCIVKLDDSKACALWLLWCWFGLLLQEAIPLMQILCTVRRCAGAAMAC